MFGNTYVDSTKLKSVAFHYFCVTHSTLLAITKSEQAERSTLIYTK